MTGHTLKRQRRRAGLTQVALAAKLGVAGNTVYRWEANLAPITAPMAKLIALTLNAGAR